MSVPKTCGGGADVMRLCNYAVQISLYFQSN
jgi:hypothetical protein